MFSVARKELSGERGEGEEPEERTNTEAIEAEGTEGKEKKRRRGARERVGEARGSGLERPVQRPG